jgi:hypothetical protein
MNINVSNAKEVSGQEILTETDLQILLRRKGLLKENSQ